MTAETGYEVASSRSAVSILVLAALAAAFCIVAPSTARAQQSEDRVGLLNRLFSPFGEQGEQAKPKAAVVKTAPRGRKTARQQAEGAEPPQVTVVTKRPDAHVVLVVGDFLASGLAEGLTTAFTQNPNVRIVDRTSGSSGFVRKDFYDWAGSIGGLISEEKPAVVVVMIGANDRQQMLVDDVRETVRSENWNREYAGRAEAFGKAISARNVPFLWVGVPPFKSQKMMLDMLAFNDVYRAAAGAAGGEFIDIWDGFVDENGAYVSNGPDLNGQPARLRANDGINLARPGKRKIAFYAEKPLYKLLGQDPAAAAAEANALAARPAYRIFGPFGPSEQQEPVDLDVLVNPHEAGLVDPARPVALRTPGLDGGTELLGAVAEPLREARTTAEKLVIVGLAPKAPAGRADQFAGPQLASVAAATRRVDIDRTLNKIAPLSRPMEPIIDRAALRAVRSNVLTQPQPTVPRRAPPEIRPDRLEEISPSQAAPDVAAPEPPVATPATIGKEPAPDLAKGDPLDLAPARGAPRETYKRPKSIGPEPNRAPTAVPPPVEEIFAPAEASPEIPSASAGEGTVEPSADAKPARPASAPERAPAPNFEPGIAKDNAPARTVPRRAEPVPVAALPSIKAAPSQLLPAPQAPRTIVPNAPIEPADGVAAAKAVPATAPAGITSATPARSVPGETTDTAPVAPVRVIAVAPLKEPSAAGVDNPDRAVPEAGKESATLAAPPATTPVAPAPPTVLPEATPATLETEDSVGDPAQARPESPVAPAAPAPPTVLPERTPTPSVAPTDRRATLPVEPAVSADDVSSIIPMSANGEPSVVRP